MLAFDLSEPTLSVGVEMKKLKVVFALLLATCALPTIAAESAYSTTPHAGIACLLSQDNKKVSVNGQKLICQKVNGKYRWQVFINKVSGLSGTDNGGLNPDMSVVYNPNATQSLDIWEDMQCPYCAQFENLDGKDVSQMISSGNYKVTFHLLAFLGQESYVLDNAVLCAISSKNFLNMKSLIQSDIYNYNFNLGFPTENTGLIENNLTNYQAQLNLLNPTYANCVNSQTFNPSLDENAKLAQSIGVNSTPTIIFNGKVLDNATQVLNEVAFKSVVGLSTI